LIKLRETRKFPEIIFNFFAANDFPGKIAVLGDMYELGEFSDKEHQQMAMLATELGLEEVWLVGPSFAKHALIAGAKFFNDAAEVKNYILQRDYSGKTFFLKGSRGMKLETITEAF